MKVYEVITYNNEAATYTVSLDDNGVVGTDGISAEDAESLKDAVARFMKRGLYPIIALGAAVGSFSWLTEVKDD